MERDKTPLEQAWVGNEYSAFRKAKHRILFVKKHGNLTDKLKFYLLGFWGQPLRLMIKILMYAKGKHKRVLIKALWK
jgi:hypothetical protein